MAKTKIEWADEVWNPVWGCLNNCRYCYAKSIAKRFGKTEALRNFEPTFLPERLDIKFAKSTKRVFVNSMSDPMHWLREWWPPILRVIKDNPQIDFIFLTKGNADVYDPIVHSHVFNTILGLTRTNNRQCYDRRNPYTNGQLAHRWLLNIEPILDSFKDGYNVQVIAKTFKWIIIGAETGNNKYRVDAELEWFYSLVNYAQSRNVPVFIKPSLLDITHRYLHQYPKTWHEQFGGATEESDGS